MLMRQTGHDPSECHTQFVAHASWKRWAHGRFTYSRMGSMHIEHSCGFSEVSRTT